MKPSPTKYTRLLAKYHSNEGNNYHSENLVLLAKEFGTTEQQRLAEKQEKHTSADMPYWRMETWQVSEINQYYYTLKTLAAKEKTTNP